VLGLALGLVLGLGLWLGLGFIFCLVHFYQPSLLPPPSRWQNRHCLFKCWLKNPLACIHISKIHDKLRCFWRSQIARVVYDDTHLWPWLLGSCVKFSQTMVVVLKSSFQNKKTVAKVARLIFRAFQCKIRLNWIVLLSADCCLSQ